MDLLQDALARRDNLLQAFNRNPDQAAELRRIAQETNTPAGFVDDHTRALHRLNGLEQSLSGLSILPTAIRRSLNFATLAQDDMETLASLEKVSQARQRRRAQQEKEAAARYEANQPGILAENRDNFFAGFRDFFNKRDLKTAVERQAELEQFNRGEGFEGLHYQISELEKAAAEEGGMDKLSPEAQQQYRELIARREGMPAEISGERDQAIADYLEDAASIAAVPRSDKTQAQMEALGQMQGADKLFYTLEHPRTLAQTVSGSTGYMAPALAATVGATATAGPGAGMAVAGAGSYIGERSATIADRLEQLAQARGGLSGLRLEEVRDLIAGADVDEIISAANRRGAAVGLFDALSMGVAGKIAGWGSRTGRHVSAAGAGIAASMGMGAAGEAAGQIADRGEVHDWGDVGLEAVAEIATGGTELASAYAHLGIEGMKKEQATDLDNLTAMTDAARASKLHQRAPDVFRGLAEQIEENADIQHYYVDGNALHQSGLVAALETALPDRMGEIRQALATGGSVQIPAADILTKIAPDKGLEDAITPHLRTADGLSLHELETTGQEELESAITENAARAEQAAAQQTEADAIRDDVAAQITATGRMTRDAALQNAALPAAFYQNIAERLGISVSEAYEKYKLKVVGEPLVGLNQPMTQGFQWEFGQRRGLFGIADIPVTEISGKELGQDERAIRTNLNEHLKVYDEGGLTNRDTGWDLRISSEDRKKLAKWFGATLPSLQSQAALEEIVENAVLAESHPDSRHENSDVIGIHRLYAPVSIDGKLHRAKLTVRDYQSKSTGDKTRLRRLEAIEIENAPMGTLPMPEANLQTTAQPTSGRLSLSVRELLRDSKRDDGTAWDFSDNTLHQNADAGSKRGAFDPDTNTIALLEKADLSTFIHELGHFYFETLTRIANDLRARDNAAGGGTLTEGEIQILKDVDTLIGKAGHTLDDWNQMTLEERRYHHETVARQFEAYLMEGKAPSVELQGIFSRLRSWLFAVYKKLTALNVKLDDDVRQVFDRMLASDEAIQIAEQNRSMMPLFSTPEAAGMTAEQFADYQRQFQGASDAALDEMSLRMLGDAKAIARLKHKALKAKSKEAKILRHEAEIEARNAIMAQPVYRVWQMLTEKEKSDNPAFRLDPQALEAMDYSAEQIKTLGRKVRKSNSIHPDLLADLVMDADGNPVYDSGDALVQALLAAPEPKSAVRDLADRIMLERHGELATPEAISEAADMAAHNDLRLRVLATEYNALAKASGGARLVQSAARQLAAQAIGQKRIRDLSPAQYTRMETRAAKAALAAMKKGDIATAAAEKRNQVLQASLARAAHEAKVEVKKHVLYLRRANNLNPKEVAIEEREQIEALLERFDLRDQSGRAIDRKQSLAEWVQAQREQGIEPDIAPEMLDELKRQPWQTLTVDGLRGLVDTVRQIEHRGRTKNELLTAQKNAEYNTAIENMVASIDAHARVSGIENRTPTTEADKKKASAGRFFAAHLKTAMLARRFDGNADGGAVWEYLIRPANAAADRQTTMRAEATAKLSEILAPLINNRQANRKKSYQIAGKTRSFTHNDIFVMALNWGNEGNRQRLLGGENWQAEDLEPLLAELTAADWHAVQQIWDYFETFRPAIAAKERRVNGIEPQWVAPTPFTVRSADGQIVEMRGGYYPIRYDTQASERAAEDDAASAVQAQMRGVHSAATTRRGHTKSRVQEVHNRPLVYNFAGIYSGFSDVIHDLAWHEYLIDANKLLRSTRLQNAVKDHYGTDVLRQFKTWIQDIAVGDNETLAAGEDALRTVRRYASMAGLAFNVVSALKQPLGILQSVARVGGQDVLAVTAQFIRNPVAMTREAQGASVFMKNRARTRFRELNELRNALEQQNAIRQAMGRYGYVLIMAVQQQVDIITWHAQLNKSLRAGADIQDAVAQADQAVIDSQGSGMTKDLAAIERGGEWRKLFTVYYGFMNTVLNLEINALTSKRSLGYKAGTVLMLSVAMPIIDAALSDLLKPGDSDDWDEDHWQTAVGKAVANSLTGHFFALRELQFGGRSYSGPTGTRSIADAYKLGAQAWQGELDAGFRRALINTAGSWYGLPSAQINRSWDGFEAFDDDKTDNPLALIFGYQEKK
nr:MAG TPA: crystallin beta/gamma motif-containing protein [Caudoviricetes sp.]